MATDAGTSPPAALPAAKGIAAQGKNLGDLTLTAHTQNNRLEFALDSNLAGSSVHGTGNATLSGDYTLAAKLTFDKLAWSRLQPLLGGDSTPGLEVQQMLTRVRAEVVSSTKNKQVPWSNSSLLGEVYLAEK